MEAPPIHFCSFHSVLSPPILLALANHFYQNPLCVREKEREKKKINKGKILEIERIKKFLFYESFIPERFLKSKYLRIFILPPFLRLKYIEKIFILIIIPIRMTWMQSRGFLILRLMYFQIVFHSQVIGSFTIIIRT